MYWGWLQQHGAVTCSPAEQTYLCCLGHVFAALATTTCLGAVFNRGGYTDLYAVQSCRVVHLSRVSAPSVIQAHNSVAQ